MRISDQLLSNRYLSGVNNTKSDMQKIQQQILTQTKINRPSDSPSGTVKTLRIQDQINSYAAYINNIDNSLASLQTTVTSMEKIQEEVQKISIMLSEINNAAIDSTKLNGFADKVDLAINSLLDLANTKYENKYIFGGTDYSVAPYGYDAAGTAIEQKVLNTAGEHKVRINTNTIQKINTTGQELFGTINGTDIFNTLVAIRDGLRAGTKPTTAQAQTLTAFNTTLTTEMSTSGEVMNRLTSTKELLESQTLELQDLQQKETGVDTSKAVIDLQSQQYYLDLSYKMSSMILPKSLLDYL